MVGWDGMGRISRMGRMYALIYFDICKLVIPLINPIFVR